MSRKNEEKDSPDKLELTRKAKLRKIPLLQDQLSRISDELEERQGIHEDLMHRLEEQEDFSKRMLDRVEKYGSTKGDAEERREELKGRIQNAQQERRREMVRSWRETQDLLREARDINRKLTDMKMRIEDMEDYLDE